MNTSNRKLLPSRPCERRSVRLNELAIKKLSKKKMNKKKEACLCIERCRRDISFICIVCSDNLSHADPYPICSILHKHIFYLANYTACPTTAQAAFNQTNILISTKKRKRDFLIHTVSHASITHLALDSVFVTRGFKSVMQFR